jgi:hypothetical protein
MFAARDLDRREHNDRIVCDEVGEGGSSEEV